MLKYEVLATSREAALERGNGMILNRKCAFFSVITCVALLAPILLLAATNGSAATVYNWKPMKSNSTQNFNAIDGVNGGDIWAVGQGYGNPMHWNGNTWQEFAISPSGSSLYGLDVGSTGAWACGDYGRVFRFNGTSWNLHSTITDAVWLRSITVEDANHIWVVAESGRVSFYNGSTWTQQTSHTTSNLTCVLATSSGVWAVGDGGTIISTTDGVNWSPQASGTTEDLKKISGWSDQLWVSGNGGTILKYAGGGAWKKQSTPTLRNLLGLRVNSRDHGWAVGAGGTFLFYDGTRWSDVSPTPPESYFYDDHFLTDIYGDGASPSYVTAVGSDGLITRGPYADQERAWYFAEGTTLNNFEPYLCIQNPEKFPTTATITYMLTDGSTKEQQVSIPPTSRATVAAKAFLGVDVDFSAKVVADGGANIIVERPMYFNYKAGGPNHAWTGGSDVMGANSPATSWYFAEGTCRPGYEPYICILNPNGSDASLSITYMLGDGNVKTFKETVGKTSRKTINVIDSLGSGDSPAFDFSAKVESTNGVGVIAERSIYFGDNQGRNGGHTVMGATATAKDYYFAEGTCRAGFDPYICIQNPNSKDVKVNIDYMLGDGNVRTNTVTVPGKSRYTEVPKSFLGEGNDVSHDFSAKVYTPNDEPIIAERPMYFFYNGSIFGNLNDGHCVVGATAPANKWYFAEGTCRPNFIPYICILNPNGNIDVKITLMLGTGEVKNYTRAVKANSRYTINIGDDFLGWADDQFHDFSRLVEGEGSKIVVERPMYFNYGLKWDGGHDVMGYTGQ